MLSMVCCYFPLAFFPSLSLIPHSLLPAGNRDRDILARITLQEDRILLTQGKNYTALAKLLRGSIFQVKSTMPQDQLTEVLQAYNIQVLVDALFLLLFCSP